MIEPQILWASWKECELRSFCSPKYLFLVNVFYIKASLAESPFPNLNNGTAIWENAKRGPWLPAEAGGKRGTENT